MRTIHFILATVCFLGSHSFVAGQPAMITPPTATPYSPAPGPAVSGAQLYAQTPIVVQPGTQVAPIYPPGSTAVPLPSQTPGSVFGPPIAPAIPTGAPQAVVTEPLPSPPSSIAPSAAMPSVMVGPGAPAPAVVAGPPNPISVPVIDDDLAWDQIADIVSDYFTITREQRARRGGDSWCEGRIETAPLDGATWLEPHRQDSVGSFNRWESTFQSIRRRATVRVVPDANGYLVEVIVEKELEDLPKPEKATAGAATFRFDGSLPSNRLEQVSRSHPSPCWIPLGRDPALEQRMLAEIHARLSGITGSRGSVFGP